VRLIRPGGRGIQVDAVDIVAGQTTELLVERRADGPSAVDVATPDQSHSASVDDQTTDRDPDAEPGRIVGRVESREDGAAVEGARVLVRGVDAEASTDAKGQFTLEVPAGTWDISVVHAEFSTGTRRGVEVTAGKSTEVTWELAPAAVRLSAYEVTIPRIEGGTVQLTEQRRESSAATEVIGAEQFSKSGDSTAAGALKRVTGLTVVGGKYVYVRGLGSRYASTLLNGSTLPSPEPNKRVVPLDLFPTSMLESMTVQKTYTPDMPGDFGGGVVKMESRSYPDDFSFELGLSTGGNTTTTFRDGLGYEGGSSDWLGLDDGTRELPSRVEEATDGKQLSKKDRFGKGNYTAEELEGIGESLPNNYDTRGRTMLPDMGLSLEVGDSFDLQGDTEAGFQAAVSYDRGFDVDRYETTSYIRGDGELREQNNFEFRETNDQVTTSAILTGGLTFGDNHELHLTSLVNRITDDTTRRYEGFYADRGSDIRVTELRWVERQMMFHQLAGDHAFPQLGDLQFDWRYVYSRATRDEPDRRQYRYDYEDAIDDFALSDRPEGNNRVWSELADNNHDGGVAATLPVEVWNGLEAELTTGVDAAHKTRSVDTRRFKFTSSERDLELFSQSPEQVFSADNIGPDAYFELREVTRSTDNYTGTQTTLGGYAMANVPIVENLEANAGARLEYSDQKVETFALFADDREVGRLETTDLLPALNVTWSFADDMQLRGAASRTVNRPNFRELSNASYTEVVGGREVRGNPNLDRATITHLDARWEWYPARGESVSVGAFYKDFQNPIETTYEPGATPIVRPSNVQGARNLGLEFQGRTGLGKLADPLRDVEVGGNLALVQSTIQIDPGSEDAELLTNTERRLQGQSPYVVNAQIGWDNPDLGAQATVLYNVYGPRIAEVGIYGIPDVIEKPFHSLDLTVSKSVADRWELTAKAGNLLGGERVYTQGGRVTRTDPVGRSVSVGLSYAYE
jgi:outer membrane receptor protein involved in Fe transport